MENKRLVITIFISAVLVSILFLSNTHSVFVSENADPNTNVYKTGNLDITYEIDNDNVKFTDSKPVRDKEVAGVKPYRIKVINSGNVDYKFDVLLEDTTATNVIDYKYIMVKVGKLDAISLVDTKNNVVKEDIIVKANSSVIVDVKVYISDKISNTEVGKNFSAKLSVSGIAISSSEEAIDNSNLMADYQLLSYVKAGSYVTFSDSSISYNNVNYEDENNLGYCFNIGNKYRFNGFRLAYVIDGVPYVVSAGASYCYDNVNNDNVSGLASYINSKVISSCNSKYIYGGSCSLDSIHAFNGNDFKVIVSNTVNYCDGNSELYCGYGNDLINNGGYYWILDINNNLRQYYWDPVNGYVNNTSKFNQEYGIRVVMKLNSSIYIDSGMGTIDNPYILKI